MGRTLHQLEDLSGLPEDRLHAQLPQTSGPDGAGRLLVISLAGSVVSSLPSTTRLLLSGRRSGCKSAPWTPFGHDNLPFG